MGKVLQICRIASDSKITAHIVDEINLNTNWKILWTNLGISQDGSRKIMSDGDGIESGWDLAQKGADSG